MKKTILLTGLLLLNGCGHVQMCKDQVELVNIQKKIYNNATTDYGREVAKSSFYRSLSLFVRGCPKYASKNAKELKNMMYNQGYRTMREY